MTITEKGFYGPFARTDTSSPYGQNEFAWEPAPLAGDLNIGFAATKPYSTVPDTPLGWTSLGSITSGTAAAGLNTGSLSLVAFFKENSGSESSYSFLPNTGQHAPQFYGNYGYGKTKGQWVVTATLAADTSTSDTSISIIFPDTLAFKPGYNGLLVIAATDDSASISSPTLTVPGCTISLGTFTVTSTTSGNDMLVATWKFVVTAGAATGPATFTAIAGSAEHSSVPAALIAINEIGLGTSPGTIAVTSPPGKRSLPVAKPALAAIISPAGTAEYNVAPPARVNISSPAAVMAKAKLYGDMEGTLQIDIPTSGVLRGVDPATAASEGRVDGVEVQVWSPLNTEMTAVLEGRMDVQWLDDLNDTGSGNFTLSKYDPKATPANLAMFNLIRFHYAGETRFAFRIESRTMEISASDDHGGQVWEISGRGVLGMLSDAVLYPEYGVNSFTQKQRNFSFASREGPWYVASEWFTPAGLPIASVPADHPWKGSPEGWPDPDAQWIWATDPNQLATAGTAWFRSYFTVNEITDVLICASADDQVTLYVDGYPTIGTVANENYGFRKFSQYPLRLGPGVHLIAGEVLNTDTKLEEVKPTVTSSEVTPTYANDSNRVYIGRGFSDGGMPYVKSDGSVDGGGPGSAVFDNNGSTFWLSVGNNLGWSSAYEWVEGTFPKMKVTAVKIGVRGGPYTAYISLKDGGNNWNGSSTIPYAARQVNAGTAIRYVRVVDVPADQDAVINIDPQDADRIRVTFKATWDSNIGAYQYRASMFGIKVTNEERSGSYIRGGNYAGLLVSVATVDEKGAVTGFLHRTGPEGWLVKTGERPGWIPAMIIIKLLEEAQQRNVLGALPIKLGFTSYVDSRGNPWTTPRKDVAYGTGDDYITLLRQLTEDSEMDIWMDPATLTLHAAPKRGDDLTADVVLTPGHSLEDLTVDEGRPLSTRLVVESEFGWIEVGSDIAEPIYGRVEGFVSFGNALSIDEARTSANRELLQFAFQSGDVTASHVDTLGPRPYLDYNVGDLITLPTGFLNETADYRVLSIRISEGDAGNLKVSVETDRNEPALATVTPPPSTEPPPEETDPPVDTDGVGIEPGTTLTLLTSANKLTADTLTGTGTTYTLTVKTPGAVYTGMRFECWVEVKALDVEFVNCFFAGTDPGTMTDRALLYFQPGGASSGKATHCDFNPADPNHSVDGVRGSNFKLHFCDIWDTVDGVHIYGLTTTRNDPTAGHVEIYNCWIHDLIFYDDGSHGGTGTHNDAVQIRGGTDISVTYSHFTGTVSNALVQITQALQPVTYFTFANNVMDTEGASGVNIAYKGGPTQLPGMHIRDNVVTKAGVSWAFIAPAATIALPSFQFSGNTWSDNSQPPPKIISTT